MMIIDRGAGKRFEIKIDKKSRYNMRNVFYDRRRVFGGLGQTGTQIWGWLIAACSEGSLGDVAMSARVHPIF